jgi:hypothetical protein
VATNLRIHQVDDKTDTIVIAPEVPEIKISCCDCGLVHSYEFIGERSGDIAIRIRRDDENTKQLRAEKGIVGLWHKEADPSGGSQ